MIGNLEGLRAGASPIPACWCWSKVVSVIEVGEASAGATGAEELDVKIGSKGKLCFGVFHDALSVSAIVSSFCVNAASSLSSRALKPIPPAGVGGQG